MTITPPPKFKKGQRVMLVSRNHATSKSSTRREREPFTINKISYGEYYGRVYCQDDTSDWCSEQDLILAFSIPHTKVYR